jgi:hypothetical protein
VFAAIGSGCGSSAQPPAEAPATVFLLAAPPAATRVQPVDSPAVMTPPRPRSEWNALARGKDLDSTLKTMARQAASKGLVPVVFVGQKSCEPCESVKRYRDDPRMQEALAGTSVIEVDLGRYSGAELANLGLSPHAIPALFVLDDDGRYSGKMITGGAWGDDIPENMAPPLTEFFARSRR